MGEGNSGPEIVVTIKPKESKELLGQYKEVYGGFKATELAEKTSYDNQKVKHVLSEMTGKDPDEYQFYVRQLRREIQENDKKVEQLFNTFLSEHPSTPESIQRKEELKRRVVKSNNEPTPELTVVLQGMFPGGNFLVHGTSVEGALDLAGDNDGALKSVAEARKSDEKFRGKGGFLGISFSYNGVGALPGTWRHMAMFVTSPEYALTPDTKLVVPYYAANKEVQLVGKSYDKNLASYVEATFDFIGLSSLFGGGVINDFLEVTDPYNYPKGESPLEKDLAKVKSGEINPEDISAKYQVRDGKLIVSPSATEGDVTAGIIYSDYLLKYTEQGRLLGKSLSEITVQELSQLEKATQKTTERTIIQDAERAADILEASMAVSIPIENTIMFIPEGDLERWIEVFSRTEKAPSAFITFSSTEGPKVPNWKSPEGDWEKAEKTVSATLTRLGIPQPSVPFSQLTGREISSQDITGNVIKHLRWNAVAGSNEIIKGNNGIELV